MSVSDDLVRDPAEQIRRLAEATRSQVDRAQASYLHWALADEFGVSHGVGEAVSLDEDRIRFACEGLELVGTDLLVRHAAESSVSNLAWRGLLWGAFRMRRSLLSVDTVPRELLDAAMDGVLANRQPELRMALSRVGLNEPVVSERQRWDDFLEAEISRALLLLVRKGHGLGDLESAKAIVRRLRDLQGEHEERFLAGTHDSDDPAEALYRASRLVALYNLAALVELTGSFLEGSTSRLSAEGCKDDIDRFAFNARDALGQLDPTLKALTARVAATCHALIDASVFAVTIPRRPRSLLLDMAQRAGDRPVLELWYSQRLALQQSLLDPTRSAVVVSMPTSAGKTLLAELAIAQAYNDDPDAKVVYLAPTKALVTQVSLTLRRDLAAHDMRVRVATPVFDLDPIEAEVLKDDFEILVTTPEKLDLLVKEDHPAVRQLSLVVVDEAHNLAEPERGARLELLLAMLRRERAGTRFLLLTPFAHNADQLARWLGGQSGTPIVIDWKPNDRLVGAVRSGKKVRNEDRRPFSFTALGTAHSDCVAGEVFDLGEVRAQATDSKRELALAAAEKLALARTGGVLLLAASRPKAEERAKLLAEQLPDRPTSPTVDLVIRFLDAESGGAHPLSSSLRRGVAFHHAGLSAEGRYFIERLVEAGSVKVICATTTLAQGVHFPLSAAVIETIHRSVNRNGNWATEKLSPPELWNIVGRVGRTLEDPLGLIAFPSRNEADIEELQQYLSEDASTVASSLLGFVRALADRDDVSFSRSLLAWQPSASAFLQYILHAVAVSADNVSEHDLEALLRASFVYEQARAEDPQLADSLIRVARSYVENLREKKGQSLSGFAKLADGTGFSSPSVDAIWRRWRGDDAFEHAAEAWSARNILPASGEPSRVLTDVITTLRDVAEVKLGSEEDGEFSAERLARIASLWSAGVSLTQLAEAEYGGDLLRCAHHVYGTVTNILPWGLRAVQRVALTDVDEGMWADIQMAPAMIYHGVRSAEAIALRMNAVPRVAAEGLAAEWRSEGRAELADASAWLDSSTPEQWQAALGPDATLTGHEARALWEVLDGRRSWRDLLE